VSPLDRADQPADIVVDRASDLPLAAAVVRRLKVTGVRVQLHNDFPVGAGLGGSSAASVALLAALGAGAAPDGAPASSRGALAELSRRMETEDLGIAGGRQDHYAAAYGGALGLAFSNAPVAVDCVPLTQRTREEFEARCLVVYTGESRMSGDTIVAVLDAYRARQRGVCDALAAMARLARSMRDTLTAGDLDTLAALVHEQWQHQRLLHPAITTPRIDAILERAYAAGATGGKALGASGGGCVMLLAPEEHVVSVRESVEPLGTVLDVHVDTDGVRACQ
jgi:D-glycero-alpha-D-manno-heptose-7-phosphate kinase